MKAFPHFSFKATLRAALMLLAMTAIVGACDLAELDIDGVDLEAIEIGDIDSEAIDTFILEFLALEDDDSLEQQRMACVRACRAIAVKQYDRCVDTGREHTFCSRYAKRSYESCQEVRCDAIGADDPHHGGPECATVCMEKITGEFIACGDAPAGSSQANACASSDPGTDFGDCVSANCNEDTIESADPFAVCANACNERYLSLYLECVDMGSLPVQECRGRFESKVETCIRTYCADHATK